MASASGSGDAAGELVIVRGSKWRPRIGLVVLAILLTVMALPLVGLFFFRIYENQLVRQTEAELIGQGAAIVAIYAREVRDAALPPEKLGVAVAAAPTAPPAAISPASPTRTGRTGRSSPPSTSPSTARSDRGRMQCRRRLTRPSQRSARGLRGCWPIHK